MTRRGGEDIRSNQQNIQNFELHGDTSRSGIFGKVDSIDIEMAENYSCIGGTNLAADLEENNMFDLNEGRPLAVQGDGIIYATEPSMLGSHNNSTNQVSSSTGPNFFSNQSTIHTSPSSNHISNPNIPTQLTSSTKKPPLPKHQNI